MEKTQNHQRQATTQGQTLGKSRHQISRLTFLSYTLLNEHFFSMTLERRGFIRRVPGQARSITVIVPPESLPPLKGIQR
jgi:hypothetical protein